MPDSLSFLPEFSWRGKIYPLVGDDFLRRWEMVPQQTLACQYPQFTGPTNWRFQYTIPMRNGIAVKQYGENLFGKLISLKDDCENRERGDLVDPIWGLWKCTAIEFSGKIEPDRRDGVDIQVAFLHKPELDDPEFEAQGGLLSVGQLASDAGRLDEEIKRVFHERQQVPPPATVDLLAGIAGLGKQIERQGDRFKQSLATFARRCESIESTVAKLQDPDTAGIRRQLRRNRAAAFKLAKRVNDPGKSTKRLVLRTAKDVLSMARDAGMSVKELLTLNPGLAATPMIPVGTVVNVHGR